MFDTYKKLLEKKAEQKEGEESIITRSINHLLRPYRALFKNSDEEPKEVGIEKISQPKVTETKAKTITPGKRRTGKILWKKR